MVLEISDSALYSNFQPPDDQESPPLFSKNKNFYTGVGFRIRKLRFPAKRGVAFVHYKLDNILVAKGVYAVKRMPVCGVHLQGCCAQALRYLEELEPRARD
jgi:hypothetical protein